MNVTLVISQSYVATYGTTTSVTPRLITPLPTNHPRLVKSIIIIGDKRIRHSLGLGNNEN